MSKIADKINVLVAGLSRALTPKQREVLELRYGLRAGEPATLQEIGDKHGITRERVRQIEAAALSAVRPLLQKKDYRDFFNVVADHLKRAGDLKCVKELMVDLQLGDREQNYLYFLLDSSGRFYFAPADNNFHPVWALSKAAYGKATNFVDRLVVFLDEHRENIIKNKGFERVFNQFVNNQKLAPPVAKNYFLISKKFATNYCGDKGLVSWSEINPKTARDWGYLILKKQGRPLHFTDLSRMISQWRKNKVTNAQTVHNELIKDGRFVLLGRGTYGLREFNIMPGTAREVISNILKKNGPLSAKELIRLVLKERDFKPTTLFLNLQNKDNFLRLDDGRYTLKQA